MDKSVNFFRSAAGRLLVAGFLLGGLSACSEKTPSFFADFSEHKPLRLSEWGLFELDEQRLAPLPNLEVVRPANPLFTDYAHKLRTLWIPTGAQAKLVDGEIRLIGSSFGPIREALDLIAADQIDVVSLVGVRKRLEDVPGILADPQLATGRKVLIAP